MGDLRERMHARIGAPRADNLGIFSRESLYGLFQRLLDRRPVGLTLPAGKKRGMAQPNLVPGVSPS